MTAVNLANLARMTVSSSGTGTITLNTAVTGFLTFDLAGCSTAAAGTIVRYAINDTTKSEIAYGTYTSSSLTLTRGSSTTGMKSTNANSPIDMSNAAQVFIADSAADHPLVVDTNGTSATCALATTFTANSGITLSQNGATNFTISNTNAGALAGSYYTATTNAGFILLGGASTAGGALGALQWTGSGTFLIDASNAAGSIAFRTGAGPAAAISIGSTQAVTFSGTTTLAADPTSALQAATKQYVDNQHEAVRVSRAADQTGIAPFPTYTVILYDTESVDTDGKYDIGTATWTPGTAGFVTIDASVYVTATSGSFAATDSVQIQIYKDGAATIADGVTVMSGAANHQANVSITDQCTSSNYYQARVTAVTATASAFKILGLGSATHFSGLWSRS